MASTSRILFIFSLFFGIAQAEDLIPEGKIVLAHYMTKMVPGDSGERVWADPDLHDPNGKTAALGGLYLTLPMWATERPKMSLEEAVEFEIRAAKQLGVDGFQFYYPLFRTPRPLADYNRIIAAFIEAADARHPGFSVCLCPSIGGAHPDLAESDRIEIWGSAIQQLLDETGDSPAWLRTKSGALLFYHWVNDSFADGVPHLAQTAAQVEKIAAAFDRLAKRAGAEIDWVFHLRRTERDPAYLDSVLENFPAVWSWVEADDEPDFWDHVAGRCRESGTAYTQTVYPDYFTSKVYEIGDQHYRLLAVDEALEIGPAGLERHYRQTDLARGQTNLLRAAIERDAEIINYATWNDWPEGQHLGPEATHNFGPSILLRHFAAEWRGEKSPFSDEDVAIAFYKKHPSMAAAEFQIAIDVKSARDEPEAEDEIQIVTILRSPAVLSLNGSEIGEVEAGFRISAAAIPDSGEVKIELKRDGEIFLELNPPQRISKSPKRIDRLTYSFSSRFRKEFEALFGSEN